MNGKVIYRVRKKDQWVVEKCIPVEGCDPEIISSHWDEASAERFARQVAALDPGHSAVEIVRKPPPLWEVVEAAYLALEDGFPKRAALILKTRNPKADCYERPTGQFMAPFTRHAPNMTADENAKADAVRERDIAEIRRLQGKSS